MKRLHTRPFLTCILLLSFVASVMAFRSWGLWHKHEAITRPAISAEFVDEESLKRIVRENRKTDRGTKLDDPALHFDNEQFQAALQALAANLNDAVEFLALQRKVTSYTSPYSGQIDTPFS